MADEPWLVPTALSRLWHMQRRTFLEWSINGLSAVFAAVLGLPAIAYLTDARNRPARETGMRTVAKLSELEGGVPKEFVIRETRRDAWSLHPDDVVGRVLLIRRPNNEVDAFTTICPHLGCSVDRTDDRVFVSPATEANFGQERPQPRCPAAGAAIRALAIWTSCPWNWSHCPPRNDQPPDFDIKSGVQTVQNQP